jgi:hypothetical protein
MWYCCEERLQKLLVMPSGGCVREGIAVGEGKVGGQSRRCEAKVERSPALFVCVTLMM